MDEYFDLVDDRRRKGIADPSLGEQAFDAELVGEYFRFGPCRGK